jgi:hypothetical protein
MKVVQFPDWPEVLARAGLSDRCKRSFEITIRWYLSFCRRARVEVTVQSARDFMDAATQEKQPQAWQLEDWKEGLRWFFRTAKERATAAALPQDGTEPAVWLTPQRVHWPERSPNNPGLRNAATSPSG